MKKERPLATTGFLTGFLIAFIISVFLASPPCYAHLLIIKPSIQVVTSPTERKVTIETWFSHPMERGPSMVFQIRKSGVSSPSGKLPLSWKRYAIPRGGGEKGTAPLYKAQVLLPRPGVYQVFVEQKPYFEPTEEVFIKQIAKTYLEAFNLESGWERPLGLEAEIVPITRPFGLWEGSLFTGQALIKGQPCKNCRVEMEYLNEEGLPLPAPCLATYVTHTDSRGIFHVTLPWRGWWGIAVLGEGGNMKGPQGRNYPVELDAVIWVKTYPRPKGVK